MGAIRHIEAADTPYAYIISTENSQWWNTDTPGLEAFDAGNLADYKVVAGSQFGTTGLFPWTFPAGIAAGQYTVLLYDGDDDSLIDAGVVDWDGTGLVVAGNVVAVNGTATASVDDFKATGFLTTLGATAPTDWIKPAAIEDGAFTAAKFASGAFDAVWSVTTRELSSYGTLVSDIATAVWGATTRSLTATGLNAITAWTVNLTGNLSGSVGSVTAAVTTDSASREASKATGFAVAGDQMDFINAPNATAVTAIQTGLATSAAQMTAQNDLDILTGTDGVILATSQVNYAPAKVGDAMVLSATGLQAITTWTVDITGSLSGSVGSVTGAVGSVTSPVETDTASRTASQATGFVTPANLPANFSDMAIDETGRVTVGTNADKTGYTLDSFSFDVTVASASVTSIRDGLATAEGVTNALENVPRIGEEYRWTNAANSIEFFVMLNEVPDE
jgi:hypothetical protein